MDIDYKIGPQPNFKGHTKASIFSYAQYNNIATFWLTGLNCPACSRNTLGIGRIIHALEHELVEVITNQIRRDDGEKWPLNITGYDNMAWKWHKRTDKHNCSDTVWLEMQTA